MAWSLNHDPDNLIPPQNLDSARKAVASRRKPGSWVGLSVRAATILVGIKHLKNTKKEVRKSHFLWFLWVTANSYPRKILPSHSNDEQVVAGVQPTK